MNSSTHSKSGISVIIPSYNTAGTIIHTLQHIQKQTAYDHVLEIIVVDSSDDRETQGILKDSAIPGLKVIIPGIKIMPAVQRNIGAKAALGELLCFIDADAYPDKTWLEKILSLYESGIMVGGGSYELPDHQRKLPVAIAQYYLEFSEFIPSGKRRRKNLVPACNLFCDKELFLKLNGFPEVRASEDSLFGYKANQVSALYFDPAIRVYHIFREGLEHGKRNQLLLGRYVYLYRREQLNSFYLRGIMPYILLPFLVFSKSIRIYLRVIRARNPHVTLFHKSLPYFMIFLYYWMKGFFQGIREFNLTHN